MSSSSQIDKPKPRSSSLSTHSHAAPHPPSHLSRPSSSLSQRNASRPPSSLSARPASSATTRPQSRYSQRPQSRHARSRIVPLCQTLVSQVTGLREVESDDDAVGAKFLKAVDYAVKNLESTTINKAAASVDLASTDRQIKGQALKARLNSRDALGEALELTYERLKNILGGQNDLDQDIKMSHLPDHLEFLLQLSSPPTPETIAYAEHYLDEIKNPPTPPKPLTWQDILAEEPFEGEHWEGVYGLPPGSVCNANERVKDDWSSTPSLSPLNSDDLALDDDDSMSSTASEEPVPLSFSQLSEDREVEIKQLNPPHTYAHKQEFEELKKKQYWNKEWQMDANTYPKFNIGDPSTLGPAFEQALAVGKADPYTSSLLQSVKYIEEEDMVREVLMALQGRSNLILEEKNSRYSLFSPAPRLIHLTLASQASILSSLARTASTVQNLRVFISSVFQSRSSTYTANGITKVSRTCEAFADAIDYEIRAFDSWCASREEDICQASTGVREEPMVVSLLSTEKSVRDAFETSFEVQLSVVEKVIPDASNLAPGRRSPAVTTALLLDTLFASIQEHTERSDTVTSEALLRVFIRTVEPIWGMIGKWLKNGMGMGLGGGSRAGASDELEDEFFIESSGVGVGMMGRGLLDPEFWKEGYSLRVAIDNDRESTTGSQTHKTIPSFLQHVADLVLGAGKATGLIRALGAPSPTATENFETWRSFKDIVWDDVHSIERRGQHQISGLFSVSVDTLSRLVYDALSPRCQAAGTTLTQVLVKDCDLWWHMEAIEGLYLMRRGDIIGHFADVLFAKMDAQQSWGDFHFLNTAFTDVVDAGLQVGTKEWVQTSHVRLSYRHGIRARDRDKTISRTIKAMDGLQIEYAAPFPLSYIFRPEILQIYSEIFVFLLQIRRAKGVLERFLFRGEALKQKGLKAEVKTLYAMRSRLSWFINTLLNFLTTYVIHAQVQNFHEEISSTSSLDEIIRLHDAHLDIIQGRCLLKFNTSSLHRAILSILDISLHFSEIFAAFAAGSAQFHNTSRQSIIMSRHRSRRKKRQRKNVIGFSQDFREPDTSSDEDDDAESNANHEPLDPSLSLLSSIGSTTEDHFARIEKMSRELDGLIRFIRRGVESLAGGSSVAASAFGVLAFALEDWDL